MLEMTAEPHLFGIARGAAERPNIFRAIPVENAIPK